MMAWLVRIAESPYLNLFSGLVLVATGLVEVFDRFEDPALGVHHGAVVFGFCQALRSLPHLVHGAHDLEVAGRGFGGHPGGGGDGDGE